jgi:hypothetical protein
MAIGVRIWGLLAWLGIERSNPPTLRLFQVLRQKPPFVVDGRRPSPGQAALKSSEKSGRLGLARLICGVGHPVRAGTMASVASLFIVNKGCP